MRAGATAAFDRYWAALKDSSQHGVAIARYVDAVDDAGHTRRRVMLPVTRLAEYGSTAATKPMLRASLGEDAAGRVIDEFNAAQISRDELLAAVPRRPERATATGSADRGHRSDVRDGESRAGSRVRAGVAAGAEALAKADPALVATVARTLVGGGPQFVIARPAPRAPGASALPVEAVRQASGDRAALRLGRGMRDCRGRVAHRDVSQPGSRHAGRRLQEARR